MRSPLRMLWRYRGCERKFRRHKDLEHILQLLDWSGCCRLLSKLSTLVPNDHINEVHCSATVLCVQLHPIDTYCKNKNKCDVCHTLSQHIDPSWFLNRSLRVTRKSLNRSSAGEIFLHAAHHAVTSGLKWSSWWQIRCPSSPTLRYPNDVARLLYIAS